MTLDRDQLAALAAVFKAGSFEGAAAQLGITQPAVSLRIKTLEDRLGLALVRRGVPCLPTPAGRRLARHAEDIAVLERETLAALSPEIAAPTTRVALAVNADSLATWFPPVFGAIDGFVLDIQIDDQDHSAHWLARGEVSGAVTSTAKPAAGCDVTPLGTMRYLAVAAPGFLAKWFDDGVTAAALARAPALVFNRKDRLHARWMQMKAGKRLFPPCHHLPASHTFIDAAIAGGGWGMNPTALCEAPLRRGDLVLLDADLHLDVPLYWQMSRRMKTALDPVLQAVLRAAQTGLLPGLLHETPTHT